MVSVSKGACECLGQASLLCMFTPQLIFPNMNDGVCNICVVRNPNLSPVVFPAGKDGSSCRLEECKFRIVAQVAGQLHV